MIGLGLSEAEQRQEMPQRIDVKIQALNLLLAESGFPSIGLTRV